MMRKLFLKLLLATFPMLFVGALYICTDPFKVLYHHDHYETIGNAGRVPLDKDYTTTEMFLRQLEKEQYDSYIFGNSRSKYYTIGEWKKHINSDRCFHFDASKESLYGVEGKVALIDRLHGHIRNALFVIDAELLAVTTNDAGHLYRKHPRVSGEGMIDFQVAMFKDMLDPDFVFAYTQFLITGKVTPHMAQENLLDTTAYSYDERTNEESVPVYEALIATNRDAYYTPREHYFYTRDTAKTWSKPVIGTAQKTLLTNIHNVLKAHGTKYKIVISPLYNQKYLNTADLAYLHSLFGKDNVYDFSGINDMTADKYNYYESSHYRPQVATRIMNTIYGEAK